MLQAHDEPRVPAAGAGLAQLAAVFQVETESGAAVRWLVSKSLCRNATSNSLLLFPRYRVSGYGVKLVTTTSDDVWQYTFTLERHNAQPALEKALCHPTAEQMDDWYAYTKMKADLVKREVTVLYRGAGKAKIVGSTADQPSDRRESGYFTGESSDGEKTA